jgi:hypothetical protein
MSAQSSITDPDESAVASIVPMASEFIVTLTDVEDLTSPLPVLQGIGQSSQQSKENTATSSVYINTRLLKGIAGASFINTAFDDGASHAPQFDGGLETSKHALKRGFTANFRSNAVIAGRSKVASSHFPPSLTLRSADQIDLDAMEIDELPLQRSKWCIIVHGGAGMSQTRSKSICEGLNRYVTPEFLIPLTDNEAQ